MAKMFPSALPSDHDRSLDATLERIMKGEDFGEGRQPLHPNFDLKQRLEAEAEAIQKRDFVPYRLVLESHGCSWIPNRFARAAKISGGRNGGQWRHPSVRLRIAFTEIQVLSLFASPEDLDRWFQNRKLSEKLRREPKEERKKAISRL